MARRRISGSRIKIHHTYTIAEAATVVAVHAYTIRGWIDRGLPAMTGRKPILIKGSDLKQFIEARKQSRKKRCRSGELYCVKCREPRRPAGNMVDYLPAENGSSNLRGICPHCETLMHRRVSQASFAAVTRDLTVGFPQGQSRITDSDVPSVNLDIRRV